jgi:hypothetical protein
MKTLLSDRFAPITSAIGFLRLGVDEAAVVLNEWRRGHVDEVESTDLDVGFPECLHALEPLTGGVRPRELLVDASNGWTAYFDCSLRGTDAVSTIGYLSRKVHCQGLAVTTVPHTVGLRGVKSGQLGSLQFEMFGPDRTEFLNYVRTVALAFDGGRWVFEASGAEQWFEELDRYKARRVRDRFTSEMLERYCRALDLDVFDPGSYGPRAVLFRSRVSVPANAYVMSLKEAQDWLNIVPGQADQLDG